MNITADIEHLREKWVESFHASGRVLPCGRPKIYVSAAVHKAAVEAGIPTDEMVLVQPFRRSWRSL